MTTMRHRFTRTGNRFGVWLYRTLGGRLSSGRRDVTVLVLTVPGRRTGVPRSACVRYLETADGLVVWGTGGGAPRDPDWFRNLRAAGRAEVQVRDRRLPARARELVGDEGAGVVRRRPRAGSRGAAVRPEGRAGHPGGRARPGGARGMRGQATSIGWPPVTRISSS